jgi:hypothetical protein
LLQCIEVLIQWRTMGEEQLVRWAQARGLELTPDNRPVVVRYLRRARWLPVVGALVAVLLPTVVELVLHGELVILGFHSDGSGAPYAGPIEAYIGYLLGALCAELSLARPMGATRRAASLTPRELTDYLPRRLLRAQRLLGVAVVVGVPVTGLVPYPPAAADVDWSALAIGAAAFGAFAVGLEALERWVVRRPQPFTSPSLVAADDAIRAQSVHAIAGAGLALLLVVLSGIFAVLTVADVDVLSATMWLPALVAFVLSIRACRDIGQQPWRVRRRIDRRAGAAPA